jgi:hypothetical protein
MYNAVAMNSRFVLAVDNFAVLLWDSLSISESGYLGVRLAHMSAHVMSVLPSRGRGRRLC